MVLSAQRNVLNHLLHMNVLKRISNTELYGNQYALTEMMGDLTKACFSTDASKNVNGMRRNLQVEYTNKLITILQKVIKQRNQRIWFAGLIIIAANACDIIVISRVSGSIPYNACITG